MTGFCDLLLEGGVPLWRVATGAELLHPLLDARGCRWLRGQGIVKEDYSRATATAAGNEEWLASPFHWLIHGTRAGAAAPARRPTSPGEFPLLDRFRDEGSTDYLALAVEYGDQVPFAELRGMLCSFQTDRPGGFAEPRWSCCAA